MINEFKHGQTCKIWPFPLSLSLYSTFKCVYYNGNVYEKDIGWVRWGNIFFVSQFFGKLLINRGNWVLDALWVLGDT